MSAYAVTRYRLVCVLLIAGLFEFGAIVSSPIAAQEPPPDAPPKATPLSKAMAQARRLAEDGKFKEAAKVMADLVQSHPKDRQILFAAAQVNHRIAFIYSDQKNDRKAANPYFYAAARYCRRLIELSKGNLPIQLREFCNIAIYNEACSLAIDGKHDEALKSLEKAMDEGFDQYDVAKEDADFDSLRKSEKHKAHFEALLKKMKEKSSGSERPSIRT